MAVTKIKPIKSTLSKALDYIENPDKTDGKMLVSSFGCSYETADIEFEYTLSQALQKGNNLAFHLIQSFEPGEVRAVTAITGIVLACGIFEARSSLSKSKPFMAGICTSVSSTSKVSVRRASKSSSSCRQVTK